MSANIKCFVDENCTQELVFEDDSSYTLNLAPIVGLNGDTGETYDTKVWFQNVGTRAALNVRVLVSNDRLSFENIILDDGTESQTDAFVGDMKEREKRSMTIRIIVPRWTQAQLYLPVIAFDYYTLPEIDETFYNPYTDPREVVE